jgi:hypothetical protein
MIQHLDADFDDGVGGRDELCECAMFGQPPRQKSDNEIHPAGEKIVAIQLARFGARTRMTVKDPNDLQTSQLKAPLGLHIRLSINPVAMGQIRFSAVIHRQNFRYAEMIRLDMPREQSAHLRRRPCTRSVHTQVFNLRQRLPGNKQFWSLGRHRKYHRRWAELIHAAENACQSKCFLLGSLPGF